jgi:nucleotide-binding universal stress UspA family protein
VLANTDWELIRNCPCPVWFVRSPKLPKRLNLLVAVDPAHSRAKPARLDEYLLETASTVARNLNGKIDVLHAYFHPHDVFVSPTAGPVSVPLKLDVLRRYTERLKKSVDKIADRYGIEPKSRHVEAGTPHEVLISSVSRLHADALVMGAVSRSGFDRLLIGSTAERVIDHVPCDVIVVKPAGARTQSHHLPGFQHPYLEVFTVAEHLHAIVWIDHREAKIFYVDASQADKLVVPSHATGHHAHHKANVTGSGHQGVDKEFFKRVIEALANAADILVVGPANAKSEFKNYMTEFAPKLASQIVGVESLDHPSDPQLIALARQFFKVKDTVHA